MGVDRELIFCTEETYRKAHEQTYYDFPYDFFDFIESKKGITRIEAGEAKDQFARSLDFIEGKLMENVIEEIELLNQNDNFNPRDHLGKNFRVYLIYL